jgi:hypothetical protein
MAARTGHPRTVDAHDGDRLDARDRKPFAERLVDG